MTKSDNVKLKIIVFFKKKSLFRIEKDWIMH